jgi:YesN/AraC family two-component response regulator
LSGILTGDRTVDEAEGWEGDLSIKPGDGIVLTMLRIDRYLEFLASNNAEQRQEKRRQLLQIAIDAVGSETKVEAVDAGRDSIVLLIGLNNGFGSEDRFEDLSNNIQAKTRERLGLSLSAAISSPIKFDQDIALDYSTLVELSGERFFAGRGCVILPSDSKRNGLSLPSNSVDHILENIQNQRFGDATEIVRHIIESSSTFPYLEAKHILQRIQISAISTLESASHAWKIDLSAELTDYMSGIKDIETSHEYIDEFEALLNAAKEKISIYKSQKSERLMDDVKKYIEFKYSDSNLCLRSIANDFSISPTYLGRIFKQYTGYSVSGYINKARVEKAKSMLLVTNLSIQSIVVECGFSNAKYFFTLFKHQQSQTPQEYRRTNKK